jgi:hypothetical protein
MTATVGQSPEVMCSSIQIVVPERVTARPSDAVPGPDSGGLIQPASERREALSILSVLRAPLAPTTTTLAA